MGFPKGTILGKHKRDAQGRLLNKDGSLYKLVPNRGQAQKGQRRSPDTEFEKGHTPHNKGKRWSDYMPEHSVNKVLSTAFKKGDIPKSAKPLGTVTRNVRKNGKGVDYTINIDWHGNRKPHNSYKWYLWEVENQQDRPKGMVLAVKNGNQDDIRIENLELISRAENLRRNAPHLR